MGVDDKILAEEGLKTSKKITRLTPTMIKASPQFWELKHEPGFRELDAEYISDEDIKAFIVEDILSLDHWREQHNKEITLNEEDLLRFIPRRFPDIENKVREILHSPELEELLIFKLNGDIVLNSNKTKEAMDLLEIVYDDVDIINEVTKENNTLFF